MERALDDYRGEPGGESLWIAISQGRGEIFSTASSTWTPRGEGRGLTDSDDTEAMKRDKGERDAQYP